jgi:hypothetical protein
MKKTNNISNKAALESKINDLYVKSGFINDDMNWEFKLLEMLQDESVEAYDIYQSLNEEQKEGVLDELYHQDNDMGAYGEGDVEVSIENLEILLEDAKNGKKYAKGGGVGDRSEGKFWVLDEKTKFGYAVKVNQKDRGLTTISYHKTKKEAQQEVDSLNKSKYAEGGGVEEIPKSLQKRIDSLEGRLDITKEKALEAYRLHIDKGYGGSGIGYELFNAKNQKESTTFGDLAIDLGRFYSTKKYAEGGGVEQKDSLLYFVTNQLSSGMIANRTSVSDYKTIDRIRAEMVFILQEHGDEQYSISSLNKLIEDAEINVVGKSNKGYMTVGRRIYAEGGSVEDTGNTNVLQYFSSLNMSALPNNAVQYIQDQILTDSNINLLPTDDEDFVDVKNAIAESFPNAVGSAKQETAKETKSESSIIAKLEKEISELNELIDMESDQNTITKLQKEIEDLGVLIEMER